MAQRFGEKISDQDAYDTARNAAKDMSTEGLQRLVSQDSGSNQAKALADELASRQA